MAEPIVGKDGKVSLGENKVIGMGTWNLAGVTADEFDASQFGDNWKQYVYGMKDGGTVSFSGWFDPTDTTGQIALQKANLDNLALTSMRFYYNNTSYYEACQTTGYFGPGALSSGQNTLPSNMRITSYNIGFDKSGIGTIDFTAKVSGVLVRAN